MSNFYIVATPIGNMQDITLRALAVLQSVDTILCEDTRTTGKLLERHGIKNNLMSFHAQSKLTKVDKIFDLLEEGKNLALVSDAGTPTISDPGALLISQIKERYPETKVIPVPGPSALITALSASGLPTHEFTFLGFLPHKKGRETLFKEIAASERTVIFYESTHRILKTLESLDKFCPEKKVCIARELTKIYEEIVTDTAANLFEYLTKNPEKQKGEFVVLVSS
ncbi:MAG: 16S rRNA (cytidine(1402)-2'-O)-methyltransferase [Candidatus Paceibacterota bacterium]